MRPTLSLGPWRVALDLAATKAVQHHPGTPAHQCICAFCEQWRRTWSTCLPADLIHDLRRACIDIDHPSDAYASDAHGGRILFHGVGKVLSGPAIWLDNATTGATLMNHHALRRDPWLGLAVVSGRDSHAVWPSIADVDDLLVIDLRMAPRGRVA